MPSGLPKALATAKIALVDDEPTTLDVLAMFLEDAGFENVVLESDARRVLAWVAAERPDTMVLNLRMPEVDGFEILRALQEDPALAAIPVIVLTSATDATTKRRALQLGAADFLAKPVDSSELVLRLRNTLAAAAHRRAVGERSPVREEEEAETRCEASVAGPGAPLVSRLRGDPQRVRRIVESFAGRLEGKLAEMETRLVARDFESVADLAHWLEGAAGTVGFDAFDAAANAIRELARDGSAANVSARLAELRALAARIAPGDRG